MKVRTLTQKINQLIENKEFDLAFVLVKQHPHYHENYMFNDAYATLLYCTNQFTEAKEIISFNIKLICKQSANIPALLSSYYLKSLCYLAENNTVKSQDYLNKCLRLSENYPELHKQFQQLLR